MNLPKRKSLVDQSVEYIQHKIAEGVFSGPMPTEHELSRSLLVSRNTIRAAFVRLEEERWIGPARQGTRRKILKFFPKKGGEPPFKIAYLAYAPLEKMRPHDLAMLASLRSSLAPLNGRIEILSPPPESTDPLESTLERLVRQTAAEAWLITRSSSQVQQWFSEKAIPTIQLGTPKAGIRIHSIDCDWYQVTRNAAQRLLNAHHRRLLYLSPRDALEGVRLAEEGFIDATKAPELGANGHILHYDSKGADRQTFLEELRNIFQGQHRPTAVITHRAGATMTLLAALNALKLRVGQDVSLISMEYDELFSEFSPAIAGYRTRQVNWVSQILEMLTIIKTHIDSDPIHQRLMPEEISGETVLPIA